MLELAVCFLREARPRRSYARAREDALLLVTVLESVGKSVAGMRLPRPEVARWAKRTAAMVCGAIGLARSTPASSRFF